MIDPKNACDGSSSRQPRLASGCGYRRSRFNALRHGVLSKHVVLMHEDEKEYSALVKSLTGEHRPSGPTEEYLIEELAGCIWRKRRLLMAEGAAVYDAIGSFLQAPLASFAEGSPARKLQELTEFLTQSPAQLAVVLSDCERALEQLGKAGKLLSEGAADTYSDALNLLPETSRDLWDDLLEESAVGAHAKDLLDFIVEGQMPYWQRMATEARDHNSSRLLALGSSIQASRLEPLARYEAHLDRKLERVLGMLLRLQDMRRGQSVSQKTLGQSGVNT